MKKEQNNLVKNQNKPNPPVNPEKDIPVKQDKNPGPTKPKPGGDEPEKNDPTRIEEPSKNDPTPIDNLPAETQKNNDIYH